MGGSRLARTLHAGGLYSWRIANAVCFAGLASLAASRVPSSAVLAQQPDPDDKTPATDGGDTPLNFNLVAATLGGTQVWTDEFLCGEYRIQRNVLSGHYRLLDDHDQRLAWGTEAQCRTRFQHVVAEQRLRPVRGKVVILLHGLGRSKAVLAPMADYLRADGGYTPLRFGYASTREGIEQHAEALRKVIDGLGEVEELNFVGHSLGNIVLRHYLADEAAQRAAADPAFQSKRSVPARSEAPPIDAKPVGDGPTPAQRPAPRRIVMLGPPNNGAMIAKRLHGTGVFGLVTGRSGEALGGNWDQLVGNLATPSCEFGIVAGGTGDGRGHNPLLPGDDDLVVRVEETKLRGARDFLLVPFRHSQMLAEPKVQEAVLRFLRSGHFREQGDREPIDE